MSDMLWGKSGEIPPERIKRLGQSGNCSVVDMSGDENKV